MCARRHEHPRPRLGLTGGAGPEDLRFPLTLSQPLLSQVHGMQCRAAVGDRDRCARAPRRPAVSLRVLAAVDRAAADLAGIPGARSRAAPARRVSRRAGNRSGDRQPAVPDAPVRGSADPGARFHLRSEGDRRGRDRRAGDARIRRRRRARGADVAWPVGLLRRATEADVHQHDHVREHRVRRAGARARGQRGHA